LAVVLMLCDHLAFFIAGAEPFRLTAGRLAMPAFALVVGALANHPLSARRWWQWVAAATVFPFLHLYAFGSLWPGLLLVWLLGARELCRRPWAAWLFAAVCLTLTANHLHDGPLPAYEPWAVALLVMLGWWGSDVVQAVGDRLPGLFGGLGRRSLSIYVGHVAAIAIARVVW
jgi:hypothetical protein